MTRHCADKLKRRKSFEEEDLELPNNHNDFNNNVMKVNHNRRGCRELNDLGPVQHSSRLRSGRI